MRSVKDKTVTSKSSRRIPKLPKLMEVKFTKRMKLKTGEYIKKYRKDLLHALESKDLENHETSFLSNPTTTNIRRAVIDKYERENIKGKLTDYDISSIKYFVVGSTVSEESLEETTLNPFRSLSNFLLNPEIKTRSINLNLLAWLLDFEPRPFKLYKHHLQNNSNGLEVKKIIESFDVTDEEELESQKLRNFHSFFKQFLELYASIKNEGMEEVLGHLFNPQIKKVLDHWGEKNLRPIIESILEKKLAEFAESYEKLKNNKGTLGKLALYLTPVPKLKDLQKNIIEEFCYQLENFGLDDIDFQYDVDMDEDDMEDEDVDDLD